MLPPSKELIQKRLRDLDPSQELIETVSLWVLHNRKHVDVLTAGWIDAFDSATVEQKRLALVYLVNDVCQKAKRKNYDDFIRAFVKPVVHAIHACRWVEVAILIVHISCSNDDRLMPKIDRCVNIWQDRCVFDAATIARFRSLAAGSSIDSATASASNGSSTHQQIAEPTDDDLFPRVTDEEEEQLQSYDVSCFSSFLIRLQPSQLVDTLTDFDDTLGMLRESYALLDQAPATIAEMCRKSLTTREAGEQRLDELDAALAQLDKFVGAVDVGRAQHAALLDSVTMARQFFGQQCVDCKVVLDVSCSDSLINCCRHTSTTRRACSR